MEGYSSAQDWVFSQPSDDPVASEFDLTAPFLNTSLVQTIYEYGTTTLSYVMPPRDTILLLNESFFRTIHDIVSHLCTIGQSIRR